MGFNNLFNACEINHHKPNTRRSKAIFGGSMADSSRQNTDATQGVLALTDAIQYQDNGIVSRTILKRDSGNITLFAFDTGQELSEHTTPYEALLNVFEGEARVSINSNQHNLKAGDLILLPANVPHAAKAIQRFKMMLIMVKV